jgi:hypothetical protein
MHIDKFEDFVPFVAIGLTIWVMRARFTSKIDTPWPLFYYAFLVIFVRANEGDFNNTLIFAGVVFALFLRYEFMGGFVLKAFRTGEFLVHIYILVACFALATKP